MSRIEEIETRLAAIANEIENEGADIDALTEEVKALKEEKRTLENEAEKRAKLRKEVSGGAGVVVRNFVGNEEKKSFTADSPEYRTAWLKKLQGKELTTEERAAMTATATIPTETMNMIVHRLELTPIINAVDVSYIPGNLSFPVEKTVNAANWVAMGSAATDSEDALEAISLGAYKLIKTISITADVSAMAVPAFEQWLISRLVNKMNVAIANAILQGDGSNKATGITHSGVITNTGTWTSAGMTYADLLKILSALPTQYHPGATLVTTRAVFFEQILGMKTDGGDKVVVEDVQSPAKFNVLGYPVIVDDNCKADTIIFGDFKEYKFNFASPIEVKSDESAEFRTGSVVYRAMCLADGKVVDKNAFTVFTKALA